MILPTSTFLEVREVDWSLFARLYFFKKFPNFRNALPAVLLRKGTFISSYFLKHILFQVCFIFTFPNALKISICKWVYWGILLFLKLLFGGMYKECSILLFYRMD